MRTVNAEERLIDNIVDLAATSRLAGRREENHVSMDGRPEIVLVLTKRDSRWSHVTDDRMFAQRACENVVIYINMPNPFCPEFQNRDTDQRDSMPGWLTDHF